MRPDLPAGAHDWAPDRTADVLRVRWLPGTDRLLGECHCGLRAEMSDPVEVWDWLETHRHRDPG